MFSNQQNWDMDTGSDTGILKSHFNSSTIRSVIVGNVSTIPVTRIGHTHIPNPHHPFHLKNVLVMPNIVKNLIFVRQFTKENRYSIEFDHFGFSVKDLKNRQLLLRCDNTCDLHHISPQHASAFSDISQNQSHSL